MRQSQESVKWPCLDRAGSAFRMKRAVLGTTRLQTADTVTDIASGGRSGSAAQIWVVTSQSWSSRH